jgi:hypothetical protein
LDLGQRYFDITCPLLIPFAGHGLASLLSSRRRWLVACAATLLIFHGYNSSKMLSSAPGDGAAGPAVGTIEAGQDLLGESPEKCSDGAGVLVGTRETRYAWEFMTGSPAISFQEMLRPGPDGWRPPGRGAGGCVYYLRTPDVALRGELAAGRRFLENNCRLESLGSAGDSSLLAVSDCKGSAPSPGQ